MYTNLVSLMGFLAACIMLSGCVAPYQYLAVEKEYLSLPSGNYIDVAWPTQGEIALSYTDSTDEYALAQYRVVIFPLDTQEMEVVDISKPEECNVIENIHVERLPANRLGIVRLCWFLTEHASDRFSDILAYDVEQRESKLVSRSPVGEDVVSFSFLPDMSASLQTFDSTGGLVGEVIWAKGSGETTPLFPKFSRTRDGTFSPTGKEFAFLGSEHVPDVDGGLFAEQLALQQEMAYPWTFYVSDSVDLEPLPVVEHIRYGRNAKWSPSGPYIAFSGEVQAFQGIWILDLDTDRIYRVWKERVPFDWSPDGQQIVILDSPPTKELEGPGPQLVLLTLELP